MVCRATDTSVSPLFEFRKRYTISSFGGGTQLGPSLAPATIEDLYWKAGADRWELSREEFADAVDVSVGRRFAAGEPTPRELERYLASLHVADLAVARACALGRHAAWDHFVLEYRPVLYRAADTLDPGGRARELADSLYADLYGLREDASERQSLLRYYHGRSSLATWLRAVLAQRHVDAVRARRRLEPLPDDEGALPAAPVAASDPDRASLGPPVERALRVAIEALAARDRLRLRSYYDLQLTLAEIGRITGEHEATVSRHLAKTRRSLRQAAERHLREHEGLSGDQVERAFELALEDPAAMDVRELFDSAPVRKDPTEDRSN